MLDVAIAGAPFPLCCVHLCVVTVISQTFATRSPGPQACKTPEEVSHDMASRFLSQSRGCEVNATMAKLVQTVTRR